MKTKKTKSKQLTKKQFVSTILNEIEIIKSTKPYHAFVLMSSFNEFARLELGVNIFKNHTINNGLNYLLNHYKPLGLWLTSKQPKRHLKTYKGKIILDVDKTFNEIKIAISKAKIDNKPFLNI